MTAKTVLATVLLLVSLLLLAPWYLGGRARVLYGDALGQLSAGGLRLVESHYDPGWFVSRALSELEPLPGAVGARGPSRARVRVASRIEHGPWNLGAPRILPAAAFVESRVEIAVPGLDLPPLLINARIELDGSGSAGLRTPEVDRPPGFGALGLRLSETRGEVRFRSGGDVIQGWHELPMLEMTDVAGRLMSVDNLRSETAVERGIGDLLIGRGHVRSDEVRVRTPAGDVGMRAAAATAEAVPRGHLIDATAKYAAQVLFVNGQDYDRPQLEFSINGLPAEGLARLRDAIPAPTVPTASAADFGGSPVVALAQLLPILLASDPRISLDLLRVGTPAGNLEASLSLGTRGMTPEAIEGPGIWVSRLVGDGRLSAPRTFLLDLMAEWHRERALADERRLDPELAALTPALEARVVDRARAQLEDLVRDGWAGERSGRVDSSLRLADGILTVNGKTFPLTGFPLP